MFAILLLAVANHDSRFDTVYMTTTLNQCFDQQSDWKDYRGNTCSDYARKHWCTGNGGIGVNWKKPDAFCDMYGTNGMSAWETCCACGGGYPTKAGVDDRGSHCIDENGDAGLISCFGECVEKRWLQWWLFPDGLFCDPLLNCEAYDYGRGVGADLDYGVLPGWAKTVNRCDRCGIARFETDQGVSDKSTCVDRPNWMDNTGHTCDDYIKLGYCDWRRVKHPRYGRKNVEDKLLRAHLKHKHDVRLSGALEDDYGGYKEAAEKADRMVPFHDKVHCEYAATACCACGGGSVVTATPTPGTNCAGATDFALVAEQSDCKNSPDILLGTFDDPYDCASACKAVEKCTYFQYEIGNDGECWYKSNLQPGDICEIGASGGYDLYKVTRTGDGISGTYDCYYRCMVIDETEIGNNNCNKGLNCAEFKFDGGDCSVCDST